MRSLVVAAGGVGGYDAGDEAPDGWEQVEAWTVAHDWARVAEWETAYWADGPGQSPDRVDPAIRSKVHEWILTTYQAEKEEGQPQPLDPPAAARLGDLHAPLLVMLGTLDDPGTSASMRHLAQTVPGARLEVFDGSAHMLNLEHSERFNALLLEFFGEAARTT